MRWIHHPEDAREGLSEQNIAKGSELSSARAKELSHAWLEVVRALSLPQDGAPMSAVEMAAQQSGRPAMDGVWNNLLQEAFNARESKKPMQKISFPSQIVRSVELACKGLGLSGDRVDELWSVSFHTQFGSIPERHHADLMPLWMEMARIVNQKLRLSETLEWSFARESVFDALNVACEPGAGPARLAQAGSMCAEALDRVFKIIEIKEEGPPRARAWMGASDARLAKALLRVCEETAVATADHARQSHENRKKAGVVASRSERFKGVIEASEAALKPAESQAPAPNVKSRVIGQPAAAAPRSLAPRVGP